MQQQQQQQQLTNSWCFFLPAGADLHWDRHQPAAEGNPFGSGRHQQDQGHAQGHDGQCSHQHHERGQNLL